MSATQRILLLMLPMFGAVRCRRLCRSPHCAVGGARSGLLVVGGGVYTLIKLFFGATGLGMWIVVGSALMALAVALLTLGRSIRK